ncbi:tape measure protein [Intestinimonas butyriciproducens]|uniref:tape measure protein n=1 Tax=Intestinimonas butyriciproducens TaxID=1297617 RepID=UPI001AB04D18|nr:tape measure protein [Intestinimonas butyriciproducens]MBO3281123.1 tape measure protein [Intestinimonas butyriciproducens]
MTLRELLIGLGFKIDESSEKKAEQGIQGLKDKATQLLGAIGIGFSLANLNQISEEFRTTNDQIAQATKLLGDQDEIQQKILDSANRTRASYADTARMVSNLVQENSELFGTVDEAIAFNDAATMLFRTAGKTNEQIAGLMEAINKSFAKGVVDSETISQLLEQSPEFIALLNERLGTTTDQLEQMVADGKISLADLKGAVVDNADEIAAAFDGTSYKISDALLNIRNQFGLWVADMDDTLGISEAIGTTMVRAFNVVMDVLRQVQVRFEWLAEKVGGTENLFRIIGTVAASAFGVMALPKLLTFLTTLQKIDKALLSARLKMVAIIAVITVIVLLIQDFIAFMSGDNSLIGSLFDKAGIGAENARKTILNAWTTVKEFLLTMWGVIKQAAETIFGALSEWWEENGAAVMESFSRIWEGIKTLCETLWNALSSAAQTIFGALQRFWDTWGDTIISVFSTIWNTLIALIQPFLDAIAAVIDFLANVFTGNWQGAWTAIKDFAASIWQMITTIITGALDIITSIWSTAVGILSGIFQNIWNAIVEKVTGIKDAIVNGFTAAIDWIKSLPAQALQWGADIIQGIVDGITGAISKVGDAVKGVADKIKSFLGFSVPEDGPLSDFDTYMPDMIELMTKGINAGKDKIRGALESLTGEMSVITKANVVSPSTAAVATGSTQSSRTVTQNIEINNQFNGDRAGQQKSSEAMDKATSDSTEELARALQYAR